MSEPMVRVLYDPEVLRAWSKLAIQGEWGIAGSVENLTWLWPRTVKGWTLRGLLERNFQLIWQTGQKAWKRPSPAYTARKVARGLSPLTLVRTGRMYRSVAAPGGSGDTIAFGDARNYIYGLNAESFRSESGGWSYPEIHNHLGDSRGTVRRFMYVNPTTAAAVKAWMGNGFRERLMEINGHMRNRPQRPTRQL